MLYESLYAEPKCFKNTVFQFFTNANGVLRAAFNSPCKKRLASSDGSKADRAEKQIEPEEVVHLRPARPKLELPACRNETVQEGRQIDFQVGLKSRLGRAKNSRDQPP